MNFKLKTAACTIALLTTTFAETKSRISLDSMPPLPGTPIAPPKNVVDIQNLIKNLPEFYAEFGGTKFKTADIMSEIRVTLKRQKPGATKAQITHAIKQIAKSQIDKMAIVALAEKEIGFKKPTAQDIEEEKMKIAKRFGGLANLEKRLKSDGVTAEKLTTILGENLLIGKYFKVLQSGIKISEEELEVEYNNNRKRYTHEIEVKASHILISLPKNASLKQEEAVKDKMKVILQKIKDGTDFAELAKESSTCPSGKKGGDLGFFSAKRMVKPFSDAAFKLKVGEVSGIVKTKFGFHIIKVTDRKEAGVTPLSEVKDELIAKLKQKKNNKLFKQKIEKSLLDNGAKVLF